MAPPTSGPKFKAKRCHYMALVLCFLMLIEKQYIQPILIFIFLFYTYRWEKKVHDFGRSPSYWEFQAQYMNQKMRLARYELIEWRKRKLEKEKKKDRKKRREDCQKRLEEEKKKVHKTGRKVSFALIPKEANVKIWAKIFKGLKDPKDIMSCYYTCTLFQDLLETRIKAEALLVVDNHLEKYTTNGTLTIDDILNCRLVSRSWKLSIDRFLQHHPAQLNFLGDCYPTTIIETTDTDHLAGLIQKVIRNYHYNNINPFPSRHLQLRIHPHVPEATRKDYVTGVTTLLKYFGKHVWYITLNLDVESNPLGAYESLYAILGRTPNVKVVDICFEGSKTKRDRKDISRLSEFLVANPFPQLDDLIALRFDGAPAGNIQAALKANKNLEKLEVVVPWGWKHKWITLNRIPWNLPNLKDLSLGHIRVPELEELKNVTWPLTHLTIDLGENRREPLDLEKLWTTLEKFEGTLKYLNFGTRGRSLGMMRLVLPHLEELEIHFEAKVLMDFIIPLRSLKTIKVHIYDERNYNDVHELEIIKFKDVVKTLHEKDATNIWRLFPELKNITVTMIRMERRIRKEKAFLFTRCGEEVTKAVKKEW